MSSRVVLWILILALAVGIGQPLIALFASAFFEGGAQRFNEMIQSGSTWKVTSESAVLALLSVLCAGCVGVPIGIAAARIRRPGLFKASAIAPLLTPAVLGTLAFWFVFGRGGLVQAAVPGYEGEFRGFGAVLMIHALTLPPAFALMTEAALHRVDAAPYDAARTLGSSPFKAWIDAVLPQIAPSVLAASVLVWMAAMGSLTAPFVFGTDRTLTTATVVLRQDDPRAASLLSLLVLVIAAVPLLLARRRHAAAKKGAAHRPQQLTRAARRGLLAIAAPLAVLVLLPLIATLVLSCFEDGRIRDGGLVEQMTIRHWREAFGGIGAGHGDGLASSILRSLLFAAVATVVDVAFALALVLASRRLAARWRVLLVGMASIPFAIPATVLGIAMADAFSAHGPLGIGPPLASTIAILPLAYAVRNLPILVQATDSGLSMIPKGLEDAAATLGSTPFQTLRWLIIPLLRPAILSGATLAFAASTGEFVTSILLYEPTTKPAAIAIFERFRSGSFGTAAAAGLLLTIATFIPLAILGRWWRERSPRSPQTHATDP